MIMSIRSSAVWDMTCSPGKGACAEAQGGVEASWVDLFVHAERNQRGTWVKKQPWLEVGGGSQWEELAYRGTCGAQRPSVEEADRVSCLRRRTFSCASQASTRRWTASRRTDTWIYLCPSDDGFSCGASACCSERSCKCTSDTCTAFLLCGFFCAQSGLNSSWRPNNHLLKKWNITFLNTWKWQNSLQGSNLNQSSSPPFRRTRRYRCDLSKSDLFSSAGRKLHRVCPSVPEPWQHLVQ